MDSGNKIQELLKENMRIGDVDERLILEGKGLLTNKQSLVYYTIPAVVVANILGVEDYKRIIDPIGTSDTGRALRLLWHFITGMAFLRISNSRVMHLIPCLDRN